MTLVLSKAELERMRNSVRPGEDLASTAARDRKAQLKALSAERVQHWPNTLDALRRKKENFLKDRAEQEEAKRQEIDRVEAETRRQARMEAIKKANDMLYEQTDKMKLLRSQKNYADVVHTRFQQIDTKVKVKEKEKEEAVHYHEEILRQVREGERKEQEKLQERQKKIEEVKVSRAQQRLEARQVREEIRRKNMEEGQRLRQEAQERLEEELRDYDLKQRMIAEGNLRNAAANAELKKAREALKEQERLAEEEREAEKESIEYRKRMLKELEKQRFERSQLARQRMIDRAVEELSKRSSNEQAILEKHQQEARDREEREDAEKKRKAAEMKVFLASSREQQILAREQLAQREQEETDAMLARWRQENELAMKQEADKQAAARQATIRLKRQQYEDGKEAARLKAEHKMVEIEQQRFLNSVDTQDDKRFVELCKAEIERNVREGKPIYTLLRALEYEAPALLAAKTIKLDRPVKKG